MDKVSLWLEHICHKMMLYLADRKDYAFEVYLEKAIQGVDRRFGSQ